MRILLHIGQSKTGTSAIQSFLGSNTEKLRQAGVLYPRVSIGGVQLHIDNHNPVADSLTGHPSFPNLTSEQYFGQFFQAAENMGAERIILSSEHFFGGAPRLWDNPDEQTYLDGYRGKIATLARFLKAHEVTVLLYLRPQADWLASGIGQTIKWECLIRKHRVYTGDRQFFEMMKPAIQYGRLLDIWTEELRPSKITVVPYEREALYQGNSVADFVDRSELLELGVQTSETIGMVNQSLSWEFIKVKNILNDTPKGKSKERAIVSCLEKLSGKRDQIIPYQLSEETIKEIASFVRRDNAYLNERYIEGPAKLAAVSGTSRNHQAVRETDITAAMAEFEVEFAHPRYRLLWMNYEARRLLRDHARPLHALLHRGYRTIRSFKDRG